MSGKPGQAQTAIFMTTFTVTIAYQSIFKTARSTLYTKRRESLDVSEGITEVVIAKRAPMNIRRVTELPR